MQHNFQNKNKSHLIKATQEAKRKSRHRLMGSIFLLLVALVVLLNVTSKIKQVNITPDKIEIKNTQAIEHPSSSVAVANNQPPSASQVISNTINNSTQNTNVANNSNNNLNNSTQNSSQLNTNNSQTSIQNNNTINNQVQNNTPTNTQMQKNNNTTNQVQTQQSADTGYKASIISKNTDIENQHTTKDTPHPAPTNPTNKSNNISVKFSPRIITEKGQTPTPEDILNGVSHNTTAKSKYFIQLTASSSKTKLEQMQQALNHNGIHTFIEPVKTADGSKVYRLRMGPFDSKDEANSQLSKINNN